MANEEKGEEALVKVGPIALNRAAVVLISSIALGTGGITGISALSNPRPDPFTGTEGREMEARLVARIEAEARGRQAAHARLSERIRKTEDAIEVCERYRADHRVESQRGFSLIDQCQRDLERLRQKVEK